MEISKRKSVLENLKKFSPFFKEDDIIEITEWSNGEGYDIIICENNSNKSISLHLDELEAINYLIKVLEYEDSSNK